MSRNPILETERLSLRLPQRSDFERFAEMYGDEETARYIGGHLARAAPWRKFLAMPGAWAIQGFAMFSVIEKSSGRWVGRVGPWYPDGWPGTEIGWGIVSDCWGRGYALAPTYRSMRLSLSSSSGSPANSMRPRFIRYT